MTILSYKRIVVFFLITLVGIAGGRSRTLQTWITKSSSIRNGQQGSTTDDEFSRHRRDTMETQRDHCALLAAPWMESTGHFEGEGQLFRLRVLSLPGNGPRRAVFPEQPLFRFVRRVYRCCQIGFQCRGVKGIQGRLNGGSEVEFLLSADVLSVPVMRAEVHLHIVNPHHLQVEPWLPTVAKRDKRSHTRYSVWSKDQVVELQSMCYSFSRASRRGPGVCSGDPVWQSSEGWGRLARLRGESLGGDENTWSFQDTDSDMWGEGETFCSLLWSSA